MKRRRRIRGKGVLAFFGEHIGVKAEGWHASDERGWKGKRAIVYVCLRLARFADSRSTRDQHPGEIEADLASLRLPQKCKPLLLTLPELMLTCDGSVSRSATIVMSS